MNYERYRIIDDSKRERVYVWCADCPIRWMPFGNYERTNLSLNELVAWAETHEGVYHA